MDPLLAHSIHDIKNQLHRLDACLAQALALAPLPQLREAGALSARLNAQLVELLALHRADNGDLHLRIDDHDLTDFIDDIQRELRPTLPPGMVFTADASAAAAIGAWAFDGYQVRMLLDDALRNALRHARAQVTLSVAADAGGGLVFSVCDDGPGYAQALLAGAAAPMHDAGSGLGLRFARLIADLHRTPDGRHGRLQLDNGSTLGDTTGSNAGGARLRLFLP